MTDDISSIMAREAREAAHRIACQARSAADPIADLAARIRALDPPAMITCARGSSDHAALFGKYSWEIGVGTPVASLGPSIVSVYGKPPRVRGMVYLTISQSGQSPDLVEAARAAKAGGALVVALCNTAGSPLAMLADVFIDIGAGPEQAVAATKSVLCTQSLILRLVAELTGDAALRGALAELPGQLEQAGQDWGSALDAFGDARFALVIARGPGLGAGCEMALKLKETARLQAECISAAEVHHGPKAAISRGTPAILLGEDGPAAASIAQAGEALMAMGARVFTSLCDIPGATPLPTTHTGHVLTQPIVQTAAFYGFAEKLARARGFDPDNPPSLRKVTLTL
ncbi:SIS domain-containing protein [Croceicoccus marinus]|uniref:SIS domain-containing protein n=1 Tax=Croceicoccus marinus TaxID=450378 RepID=A0A7G6VZJ3_9SPHN|nr:SIS domain-containing protein [Croceicoccus marinus]QNE07158.1 SIS domain-containing protein [Croceicoccus marinus]